MAECGDGGSTVLQGMLSSITMQFIDEYALSLQEEPYFTIFIPVTRGRR